MLQENEINEEMPLKKYKEDHASGGKYIKSILYGGLDGIVSVFVTVAAVNGGASGNKDLKMGALLALVLGLAKLVAGGISMGVGDWIATASEVDMAKRERRREEWETENFIEGEIEEMIELYVSKGVPKENATRIMEILSRHPKAFVDIMMAEEVGIPNDVIEEVPYKHGLVNFSSFMIFGSVPLVAYAIFIAAHFKDNDVFYVSIAITGFTMLMMGLVKGKITRSSMIKSAIMTLLLGGFTAFIGWFVGWILHKELGIALEE